MKNVKKLLKKAMVFAVAASMLVGTPLTASAAGIRGVYSVSDGTNDDIRHEDDNSHTGTVSNTNTSSRSGVLKDNDARIIGIVLDKSYVNAEVGAAKKETLKATVIIEDDSLTVKEKEEIGEELGKKIVWEVRNHDNSTTGANKKLSIKVSADKRTVAELNPREGTAKGEEMVVSAKIDGSWYVKRDENDNAVKDDQGHYVLEKETFEGGKSYEATADVYIKQYSDKIELVGMPPKAFVKNTVDLTKYLVRTPDTANDEITWISTNTKAATVTAAGVVTFKKAGQSGKIIAVSEKGKKAEWEFGEVEVGLSASKIVIIDANAPEAENPADNAFLQKKVTVDLQEGEWTRDVDVVMYAKVKVAVFKEDGTPKTNAKGKIQTKTVEMMDGLHYDGVNEDGTAVENKTVEITDVITWTSNKPAIVSVDPTFENTDAELKTGDAIGKAVITAKASGGKSDKLTVTVNATLSSLEITNLPDNELFSGQTWQLGCDKEPAQSKDAVVWEIEKTGSKKNPNATINNKGVLTIKPKLDLTTEDYGDTVTVVLRSKKQYEPNSYNELQTKGYIIDKAVIYLDQSNIEGIAVSDEGDEGAMFAYAKAIYKANGKFSKIEKNKSVTKEIAAEKSVTYKVQTFEAKVEGDKNVTPDTLTDADTNTLSWKTSNAKVAEVKANSNGTVTVSAKAKGTATITVSGIRENKAISTTFKVSVKQPAKTVTLNKSLVVLNQKNNKKSEPQNQSVTFKATLGPKGVDNKKNPITWTVTPDEKASINDKGKLTLTKPVVGDEFVVTASVASGASATATVKIVNKTEAVAIAKTDVLGDDGAPQLFTETVKNKLTSNVKNITIGDESFKMYPYVKVGSEWQPAGSDKCEDVAYTVNKKGIVTIDSDGTVNPIKNGTVTITAKTPLGKKTTLKVVVSLPSAE
ncbi:MAG: hypothetical protein HDR18_00075 [Lachnospiraceae bacterium]|nr:hypothetical protein [Lachnospiraceae bacterium]